MNPSLGRILAVDPGSRRIGLAISDPTQTIATPLKVINHVSRLVDAAQISQAAVEQKAILIIIGCPLDLEGLPGPAARSAARVAEAVRLQCSLPVELWDESGSTRTAQVTAAELGIPRRKRAGHLDAVAAAVILQSYLDSLSHSQSLNNSY
ncbi:MAG TPA: Holliday junction resolvase RuvX [Bellilinea sp.]|nr:Holliday junction resolvase RuvX [Bellilinea sp.]